MLLRVELELAVHLTSGCPQRSDGPPCPGPEPLRGSASRSSRSQTTSRTCSSGSTPEELAIHAIGMTNVGIRRRIFPEGKPKEEPYELSTR